MTYTKDELRKVADDCEWWNRVGGIFGATLIGFTERRAASFSAPLNECSGSVATTVIAMQDELDRLRGQRTPRKR